jgi:TetR/AcrR family transcriptional repressor of mexJK operon
MTTQYPAKAGRGRGRPRTEDVAYIEAELLAFALKEFVQHGYGATSLSRIARAAGMSKKTLWSRFSGKEHLFRAIIRKQVDRAQWATPSLLMGGRRRLVPGLMTYANRMLEVSLKGHLLEVNRLIHSESGRFPELGKAGAEWSEVGVKQVTEFIRECAAADEVRCRDPEAAAEVFIRMLQGWYLNLILMNRKVSRTQREEWVKRAVHTLISSRENW